MKPTSGFSALLLPNGLVVYHTALLLPYSIIVTKRHCCYQTTLLNMLIFSTSFVLPSCSTIWVVKCAYWCSAKCCVPLVQQCLDGGMTTATTIALCTGKGLCGGSFAAVMRLMYSEPEGVETACTRPTPSYKHLRIY